MTILTFYKNTRYAGGRSHRNISTLELVEGRFGATLDLLQAPDHYGYHMYPAKGEDFTHGIKDHNDNEVMDAADFKKYEETGIGTLDFQETVFSSCKIEDIDVEEFKILNRDYQLEYIHTWYGEVTLEMLNFAIKQYSEADVYEFSESNWELVSEEIKEEEE